MEGREEWGPPPRFQSSSLPIPQANDGILRKSYEIYNVLLYGYYMDIRLSVKEIFNLRTYHGFQVPEEDGAVETPTR